VCSSDLGKDEGDTYSEIENIIGSRYADTLAAGFAGSLTGGLGVDRMTGGSGATFFIYQSTADTGLGSGKRDLILGFDRAEGDRIDLSRIDADPLTAGDQAFTFVAREGFSGKGGEVGYRYAGDQVIVSIDLDGKNGADIEIQISFPGQILPPMYAADFVL
jgi:Ca2+-binding RTX toxin-like protein